MIWHLVEIWIGLAVMFAIGGFIGASLQRGLAQTRLAGFQTRIARRIRTWVDGGRARLSLRAKEVFSQPGDRSAVVRAVAVTPAAEAVMPDPVVRDVPYQVAVAPVAVPLAPPAETPAVPAPAAAQGVPIPLPAPERDPAREPPPSAAAPAVAEPGATGAEEVTEAEEVTSAEAARSGSATGEPPGLPAPAEASDGERPSADPEPANRPPEAPEEAQSRI